MAMPCRPAANPAAQNSAAPAPQKRPMMIGGSIADPDEGGLGARTEFPLVWRCGRASVTNPSQEGDSRAMASLDSINIGILFGSLLVLAGILSSLVALRFGAPLLLAFLAVGMLAGEAGPLGIKFEDVELTYTAGSVALGLILFDGGLRTRFQTFRNVIGPAGMLSTVGVLATAALTAPAAVLTLGLSWTEALLMGAVVA